MIPIMMVRMFFRIIRIHCDDGGEHCMIMMTAIYIDDSVSHLVSDNDNDDQLIAVECVSPGLGCTHLARSGSKPPHDGCGRQPCVSEVDHNYQAAVGQPVLVEVSPQRRGDPPGWRGGEVWLLFWSLH